MRQLESNKCLVLFIAMVVVGILGLYSHAQPPDVSVTDPNIPIDTTVPLAMKRPLPDPNALPIKPIPVQDPNAIKLPEGVRMPVRLKCPAHGLIGKDFVAIETDTGTTAYCAKCAKTFIAKVFDINLPKLEIVK